MKNNRGFAITALLYGLSIMAFMTMVLMMSIMQNSRKNNTTTVKIVEQELNNYGSTATNYTASGATSKIIPEDQAGYYKIELCGGATKKLLTGTVYLPGNTKLNINVGAAGEESTLSIDESGVGEVMNTSTEYINGTARFASAIKKYPFLNGQVIKGTTCENGFKMSKVSTSAPATEANNIFDGVNKISTEVLANISAVYYVSDGMIANPNGITTCNNTTSCTIPNKNVSDIYISYINNPDTKTKVTINDTKILSPSSSYKFTEKGFSFSRFGPKASVNITDGNYAMSLVKKDGANYTITPGKKDALSTSAYTPENCTVANDATKEDLVHYGSESLARPVLISNYISKNSQKWRFETITGNQYKIVEIEEYKPFEVHKQDTSIELNGPILVCGEYVCIDEFKSTDAYRDNMNQKWTLFATGFGTYRFETNVGVNPSDSTYHQYLYYESSKKKFYVTNNASKASLFYIFNVNL